MTPWAVGVREFSCSAAPLIRFSLGIHRRTKGVVLERRYAAPLEVSFTTIEGSRFVAGSGDLPELLVARAGHGAESWLCPPPSRQSSRTPTALRGYYLVSARLRGEQQEDAKRGQVDGLFHQPALSSRDEHNTLTVSRASRTYAPSSFLIPQTASLLGM